MPYFKNDLLKKAALILTAALLCLNSLVFSSSATADEAATQSSALSVSAHSAILIEAQSGIVIYEKNADKKMSMASTTKIMTALVALEAGDIKRTVAVSADAIGIEGSSVYLYENEKLTLEDLIYAMMLESANDAAAAIAIEVGGSIDGFAELMNNKAAELGLVSTRFSNPHGLDDEEHYTTARELAIIAQHAMANEDFRAIASTYKKTIPLNETEGVRLLVNHNKMLKGYDGAIGVKTGYTKKSGRCLVSAAERDGVELICVTLNAPDDWLDHATLLDCGFSLYESRTLCRSEDFRYIQPVIGGVEEYVILSINSDVSVTVPRSCGDIEQMIELPRFSYADIDKGDVIGYLVYTANQDEIARVPIIATYSVARIRYRESLWNKIASWFFK